MVKRVHIIISGYVQGVLFRYNTKKLAENLNLEGFVKNLEDGDVEVIAEGKEEAIKELIEFCQKGPEGAEVIDIKVSYEEVKNEFEGFYAY